MHSTQLWSSIGLGIVLGLVALPPLAQAVPPAAPCAGSRQPIPFGSAEIGEVRLGGSLGVVHDIVADANDLYICGEFDSVDGVPATNIARWTGSSWQPLWGASGVPGDEGIGYGGRVSACVMTIGPDGRLYVAGHVSNAGIQSVANIAAWDPSANSWHVLPTGGIAAGSDLERVWSIATTGLYDLNPANDYVEVGGFFNTDGSGNPIPNSHARYHPATNSWVYTSANLEISMGSGPLPGEVMAIHDWDAVGSPSKVVLGGHFDPQPGSLSENLYADPSGSSFGLERVTPQHSTVLYPALRNGAPILVWGGTMAGVGTSTTYSTTPIVEPTPGMGYLETSGTARGLGVPSALVLDFVQPTGPHWVPELLFAGGLFTDIDGATMTGLGWSGYPSFPSTPSQWHQVHHGGSEGVDVQVEALTEFDSPPGMEEELGGVQSCVWAGGDYSQILGVPAGSIGGFCCPGFGQQ